MINELILGKIVEKTIGEKVTYFNSNCLRNSNFKDKCQKCFDICPEAAIEIHNKSINIENIACSGCGKCISECPTGCLSFTNNSYTKAYLRIKEADQSKWGCIKSDSKIDVNMGCLKMVDEVFLNALCAQESYHRVNLDLSKCNGCEYADIPFNYDYFNITSEYISFESGEKEEVKDLSRRDFLRGVLDRGSEYKDIAISDLNKSIEEIVGKESYAENVDEISKKLLENHNSLQFEELNTDIIFNLKFNENCVFCKRCIEYCPFGAIYMTKTDEYEYLKYDTEKCNFCTLCIDKCKYNAIDKANYRTIGQIELASKRIGKCKACNLLTTSIGLDGLCETCSIRENNRKKLNLHRRMKRD